MLDDIFHSSGKAFDVAKVIRQRTNEALCRQIMAHLKQQRMKVPSRRTILGLLSGMTYNSH